MLALTDIAGRRVVSDPRSFPCDEVLPRIPNELLEDVLLRADQGLSHCTANWLFDGGREQALPGVRALKLTRRTPKVHARAIFRCFSNIQRLVLHGYQYGDPICLPRLQSADITNFRFRKHRDYFRGHTLRSLSVRYVDHPSDSFFAHLSKRRSMFAHLTQLTIREKTTYPRHCKVDGLDGIVDFFWDLARLRGTFPLEHVDIRLHRQHDQAELRITEFLVEKCAPTLRSLNVRYLDVAELPCFPLLEQLSLDLTSRGAEWSLQKLGCSTWAVFPALRNVYVRLHIEEVARRQDRDHCLRHLKSLFAHVPSLRVAWIFDGCAMALPDNTPAELRGLVVKLSAPAFLPHLMPSSAFPRLTVLKQAARDANGNFLHRLLLEHLQDIVAHCPDLRKVVVQATESKDGADLAKALGWALRLLHCGFVLTKQ